MSEQNLSDQTMSDQMMNAKEEIMSDQLTPDDTIINDNLCVNKTVSIGVCNTDAKLHISDPSFRGNIKLSTTSGVGHDFGYDGGIDNFFAFAHYGLESGQTKFVWHPNEASTKDLLTIKNTGKIGIGTSEPQNPLHVVAPGGFPNNVPIVAQSVSTFFGARDSAGNERFAINLDSDGTSYPVNFYDKYDGTWKRSISLKLGNVGIGTTNPQYARLMIEHESVPLAFRESNRSLTEGGLWRMPLDAGMLRFDVNTSASGNFSPYITPLIMFPNGNVHVAGALTQGSSRELKENIAELSGKEAVKALENLNPVKFNYKADSAKNLHIGFIAEDVPDLVATSDRKALSPMDIVAVLTQALKEQQKTISALAEKVSILEAQTA
ncbi:MAG TPA: hypothetical protein DDZ80_11275 [Cyanobacteria bacterium UBA8803]|nr:hypothetical protein [Cyanobacteria bacterium UBA9273]HBL59072.1 hypothetical protein [Cyanobacteria bacterium UBA8803]